MAYEPCIAFAGGVPVRVPTRWEDDFAVDPAVVAAAITPRTKAVLIGSPANPTGAVQPRAALEGAGPAGHRARPLPDLRRDLRPAHLHRRAHLPGHAARRPGAHRAARRLLQGARHDRLAGRLDLRAGRGGRAVRAGAPVHDAVRAARVPAGRGRGAVRPGPRRRRDDRRLRPAAAGVRQGSARDRAGLPGAGRRVLRVPVDPGLRAGLGVLRRAAAARRERGRGAGQRVRAVRRGPRALLLRHRAAAAGGGAGAHRPASSGRSAARGP